MRKFSILILVFALAGCAAALRSDTRLFPSAWPGELNSFISEDRLSEISGPAVLVEPVAVQLQEGEDSFSAQGEISSGEALTALLVDRLRAGGVNAHLSAEGIGPLEYRLTPQFSNLEYTQISGKYPGRVLYKAVLDVHLTDRDAERLIWDQTLEESHDRRLLVNMMSKDPSIELEHRKILIQKCVLPTFNRLAQDFKTYFSRFSGAAGSDGALSSQDR